MTKVSLFDRRHLGKKYLFRSGGLTGSYYLTGNPNARPVIILHGLTGNHIGLLPIAAHLSRYKCILPDLPGHGASPIPGDGVTLKDLSSWLLSFIKQWKNPILVTHSYAGSLSMLALRDEPGAVVGCILLNPVADVSKLARNYRRVSTMLRPALGAMINDIVLLRRSRHMYLLERSTPTVLNVIEQLVKAETALKTSREQMAFFHKLGRFFDDKSIYGGVPKPLAKKTYCVVSTRDPLVSPSNNLVLHAIFGKDHIRTCQTSGHLMPVEAYDDVARIVNKLLGKIARSKPFFGRK